MAKILVSASPEWVRGEIKRGHFETEITIPDKDLGDFNEDMEGYLELHHIDLSEGDFLLDDYELEDWGKMEISYYTIL